MRLQNKIGIVTADAELRAAIAKFAEYICTETLGVRIVLEPLAGVEAQSVKLGSATVDLYVKANPQ